MMRPGVDDQALRAFAGIVAGLLIGLAMWAAAVAGIAWAIWGRR